MKLYTVTTEKEFATGLERVAVCVESSAGNMYEIVAQEHAVSRTAPRATAVSLSQHYQHDGYGEAIIIENIACSLGAPAFKKMVDIATILDLIDGGYIPDDVPMGISLTEAVSHLRVAHPVLKLVLLGDQQQLLIDLMEALS